MELGGIWGAGSKTEKGRYAEDPAIAMDWNSALSASEQAAVPPVSGRRFFYIPCNNRKGVRQLQPDTTS